jgi:hypothetical protein
MPQGLLPHRLNCRWPATAASVLDRSAVWAASASIGPVRLVALSLATWTSIVAVPTWTRAIGPTVSLFVALRIDTLMYLIYLTLYHSVPQGAMVFITVVQKKILVFL